MWRGGRLSRLPGPQVPGLQRRGVTTNAKVAGRPRSGARCELQGPRTSGLLSVASPPKEPAELRGAPGLVARL